VPRIKTMGGQYQLQYGDATIPYELIYARRKTLAIHVYPDRRVTVKVPKGVDRTYIEAFVLKRARWILKHLQKFEQNPVPQLLPRQYTEGESYRYLGEQYHLKLVEADREGVQLAPGTITVSVRDASDKKRIARLLDRWFRHHAERVFMERLEACFPR
jgi:predicted metal-dependent hydrolase